MVNVWRLMAFNEPGHRQQMIQWSIGNCRIAIGWTEVRTLNQYETPGDIQHQVFDIYEGPPGRSPTAGIQLWNFRGGTQPFYPGVQGGPDPHRLAMQCGDLVILKANGYGESVVMRVQGPYELVPAGDTTLPPFGYGHQRKAEVTDIGPQALWDAAGGILPGQDIHNALVRLHEVGQ